MTKCNDGGLNFVIFNNGPQNQCDNKIHLAKEYTVLFVEI